MAVINSVRLLGTSSNLFFPTDDYIQRIVRSHFDPELGTPYWIRRDSRLRSDALHQVKSFVAFKRIVGFKDDGERTQFEHDTRFLPLEDFIPLSVLRSRRFIWASQTGGTTGAPKHGNWDSVYWRDILAFSDEFLDLYLVPRYVNWLFIGPMGPHTTGRLVVSLAEHRGGRCFSIDLDPRIVKIFGAEQNYEARDRYLQHIWDQVESIIRYQRISVVFSTSRLLEMLPEYLDPKLFESVGTFIHAGTSISSESYRALRVDVFRWATIFGLYGTSTTGISYQKPLEDSGDSYVIYIPSAPYVVLDVVDDDGQVVPFGQEGHVVVYRLTEDSIIPGFWERDRAIRIKPYGVLGERFPWTWIGDPFSPEFTVEGKVEGVY